MWDILIIRSFYLAYLHKDMHFKIYSPTKEQFLACLTQHGKKNTKIIARKNPKNKQSYIRFRFK